MWPDLFVAMHQEVADVPRHRLARLDPLGATEGRVRQRPSRWLGTTQHHCGRRLGRHKQRRGFGMVQRYMEKEGQPGEMNRPSHWFDVPEGYALDCLVIGEGE